MSVSWRRLAPIAISLVALGGISATPALAASSGSSTGTVNVAPPAVMSLTVSPSTVTFTSCIGGSSTSTELGFPNASCVVGSTPEHAESVNGVTVTNTGVAGLVDVNGGNAVPSDNGTPWTLCNTSPTCTGTEDQAGANQYQLATVGWVGTGASQGININLLANAAGCDTAFDQTVSGGCNATSGQSQEEQLSLVGPESSTDTSDQFTTTVTWTAVPS
jgi:hypothetical protein